MMEESGVLFGKWNFFNPSYKTLSKIILFLAAGQKIFVPFLLGIPENDFLPIQDTGGTGNRKMQ